MRITKVFFIFIFFLFQFTLFTTSPACNKAKCLVITATTLSKYSYNIIKYSSNDSLKDTILTTKDTMIIDTADSLSHISKDAIESTINYFAKDSMLHDIENNIISLFGEAWVEYEDIRLEAAMIKFDWENELIYAEGVYDTADNYIGAPIYTDKGKVYKSKKIIYNFKSKKAKIFELKTKEGDAYIHGKIVKKDSNDVVFFKDAKYTTCDLDEPHFYIAADKIKVIPNKNIITGPAYMVIGDVPLPLGIPFGFFPGKNKRSSGIILPTYGESQDRGFFFKNVGYYFGLSDYFDLQLTGDIHTRGSWLAIAKSNYKKKYKYNGNLYLHYGINKYGDPEAIDYFENRDFTIKWSHKQDPKARPNSSFNANVNAGSQNSLRNNSTNPQDIVKNTLSSGISYRKTFAGTPFSLTTSLAHSQNLAMKTLSLTAPNASFNVKKVFPFKNRKAVKKSKWYNNIGLNYTMKFRNELNTYDSLFLQPETWEDWKYGFKHSIPISTSIKLFKYLTFTPSFSYTGRTYFNKIEKIYVSEYDSVYRDSIVEFEHKGLYHTNEFSVTGGFNTRIYGMFNINRFGIIAIRHLITPNISFSYRPDFSDPKFGYYEDVQIDSIGNTQKYALYKGIFGTPGSGKQGNISFSIQNNIEAKVKTKSDSTNKTKNIKLLDYFNFSGSYNTLKDSMKLSMINFSGRTSLFKNKFNIQFSGIIDPYYLNPDSVIVDQFEISQTGKLGRFTNANLSFGSRIKPSSKKGKNKSESRQGIFPDDYYVDFSVPWSLSFNYTFNYSRYKKITTNNILRTYEEPNIIQSFTFRGDLSLTSKWKITFSSGYDLKNKKFTITSIDLHRDLHCWEMSFNTIPFGTRRHYMFKINVKSSVLKDLKFDKKKYFYDYD